MFTWAASRKENQIQTWKLTNWKNFNCSRVFLHDSRLFDQDELLCSSSWRIDSGVYCQNKLCYCSFYKAVEREASTALLKKLTKHWKRMKILFTRVSHIIQNFIFRQSNIAWTMLRLSSSSVLDKTLTFTAQRLNKVEILGGQWLYQGLFQRL